MILADGFGSGEAALTGVGLIGVLVTVVGYFVSRLIRQQDENAKKVAAVDKDLAIGPTTSTPCSAGATTWSWGGGRTS